MFDGSGSPVKSNKETMSFPLDEGASSGHPAIVSQTVVVNIQKPQSTYLVEKSKNAAQVSAYKEKDSQYRKDYNKNTFGYHNKKQEELKSQGADVEKMRKIDKQLKDCHVCKKEKKNHLEKEKKSQIVLESDIHKMAEREVIEQIVFDPQYGVVKREIHFGIIDYLTVRNHIYILLYRLTL